MRSPLFGAGLQGKSSNVSSQRRVNFYSQVEAVEDKTRISFHGTPGLSLFADFGDTPVRGEIAVGTLLYVVHRGTFWEVNNAGVMTSRGTLNTTTGRVDMRYNGTQILIVDGTNGYIYTVATTTLTVISAAGFVNASGSCAWQDGYFLTASTNLFAVSTLDNGSLWNALERADAEASPDEIIRIYETRGEVYLFGPNSTEPWANTGALDFPYGRIGNGVMDWGLAAKWSLAPYEGTTAGLFQNNSGNVRIGLLNGYSIQPISTPDLDYLINEYSVVSDATALSYRHSGHSFLQINFPAAGKSWLFDGTMWSELASGTGRHRAEMGCVYLNKIIVSDYSNGKLYRLTPGVFTENGETIYSEIISRHLTNNGDYATVDRLWIDMETGVGTTSGQGSDPQVMLSISRDGGHTFGNELWASYGALGNYGKRAEFRRLGRALDFVFKLRISDPTKRVILGEGYL